MELTREYFEKTFDIRLKKFATKKDLKRFATKEDLKVFATKKDLEMFANKSDLVNFATKQDLEAYATKEDMRESTDKILSAIDGLATQVKKTNEELPAIKKQLVDMKDWILEASDVIGVEYKG